MWQKKVSNKTFAFYLLIKYWFKILTAEDHKYIKLTYKLMLNDIEASPNTVNWASLLRRMLSELGFYDVWVQQGVGNYDIFIRGVFRNNVDFFNNFAMLCSMVIKIILICFLILLPSFPRV